RIPLPPIAGAARFPRFSTAVRDAAPDRAKPYRRCHLGLAVPLALARKLTHRPRHARTGVASMLSRRALLIYLPAIALTGSYALNAFAADKTITVGINLPLTGADAHDAELIKAGAMLALDEASAEGGVAGHQIKGVVPADGTAPPGQYDPAQAATNARKMVADTSVV